MQWTVPLPSSACYMIIQKNEIWHQKLCVFLPFATFCFLYKSSSENLLSTFNEQAFRFVQSERQVLFKHFVYETQNSAVVYIHSAAQMVVLTTLQKVSQDFRTGLNVLIKLVYVMWYVHISKLYRYLWGKMLKQNSVILLVMFHTWALCTVFF